MSKMENKLRKQGAVESDDLSLLTRIAHLLEVLVRLNLEASRGNRSQGDMIAVLDSVGCGQTEIADLLGTTPNTVNVTLYNAKKKRKK